MIRLFPAWPNSNSLLTTRLNNKKTKNYQVKPRYNMISLEQFLEPFHYISQKEFDTIEYAALYITLAGSVYYVLFGTVLSVSNMVGDVLKSTVSESSRMKLTFISGLVFCSALIKNLYHEHLTSFDPFDSPSYTEKTSPVRLIFAGLLVGFGSQYAKIGSNNSFSLDGAPQFSLKSIIGSIIVLISACLTHSYAIYKYLPPTPRIIEIIELPENISYSAYLLVFMLIPFVCYIFSSKKSFKSTYLFMAVLICYLALFTVGVVYAYCLMFGGFAQRKVAYTFFGFPEKGSAILLLLYWYGIQASGVIFLLMRLIIKKPLFGAHVIKDDSKFKLQLIIGSVMYGIGWGLGGLRVGQVLVLLPLESIKIVFYWGLACLIGMKFSHKVFEQTQGEDVVPQEKKTE